MDTNKLNLLLQLNQLLLGSIPKLQEYLEEQDEKSFQKMKQYLLEIQKRASQALV